MKGIRVDFSDEGCSVAFDQSYEGFETTCQNAMVNLGTMQGSDPYHPTKGTRLLIDSVMGFASGDAGARHVCNFAAVDTLFFSRESDAGRDLNVERMSRVVVEPVGVRSIGSRDFNVVFQSTTDRVVGRLLTAQT